MLRVRVTRTTAIPDKLKVERYRRVPELGPKVLFFSGGSALKKLSQLLIGYTHNSIHLITSFDSGGSSAELRKNFLMPAIGDIRNRMMALSDRSVKGNPGIYRLFSYRLSKGAEQEDLLKQLESITFGDNPLIVSIAEPMQTIIRNYLTYFMKKMPPEFDLRGASIGNLILAGGYLTQGSQIDPAIFLFSKLVESRGTVRPISSANLHLAAKLANGTTVVGQHLLTGKETSIISSPVEKLYLTSSLTDNQPQNTEVCGKIRELIRSAELICYPMGSFYSSLLANFLPRGVGQAIRENGCPKVFVPNMGRDPEQFGMTMYDSVNTLLKYLRKSCYSSTTPNYRLLNFIVFDSKNGFYPRPISKRKIAELGITIIDTPLITEKSHPLLDEEALIEVLLSLV